MNRKIVLSLLLLLPFMALAQQNYTLTGDLGEEFEMGKASLQYRDGGQSHVDSTIITKGKFTFSGQVHKPEKAVLSVERSGVGRIANGDFTELYLEKGEINIKGTDSVSIAILTGTPLNIDQGKLNHALIALDRKQNEFVKEMNSTTKEEQNDSGFMERSFSRYDAIQKEKEEIRLAFIKENPHSLVSLNILLAYATRDLEVGKIEPLLDLLSPELQKDPRIVGIRRQLEAAKNFEIGAIAPDFTQNDPDGKPISLSSFKGKYVLIDFWASWCMPCRQENPNLVAAYHKFKDKNFTILGVSLDRENGRDAWLKAIEDDQLDWTQVSDLKFWNNEAAKLYGIRSIPQSYLLDPSGKIIGKNLRGEELHRKLAEILD